MFWGLRNGLSEVLVVSYFATISTRLAAGKKGVPAPLMAHMAVASLCSLSRKANTQCVLYSDPGQRVRCAFFFYVTLRLFLLTQCARFYYSDPPPRFLTAFFFFLNVFPLS